MSKGSSDLVQLELAHDEALVLFEWLARLDEKDAIPYEDASEQQVLWSLHAQLDKARVRVRSGSKA